MPLYIPSFFLDVTVTFHILVLIYMVEFMYFAGSEYE